jgi:hypothetical protein
MEGLSSVAKLAVGHTDDMSASQNSGKLMYVLTTLAMPRHKYSGRDILSNIFYLQSYSNPH